MELEQRRFLKRKRKRQNAASWSTGKSPLTISAKPVGRWGWVSTADSRGRTILVADAPSRRRSTLHRACGWKAECPCWTWIGGSSRCELSWL